jgi:hypothetical protein
MRKDIIAGLCILLMVCFIPGCLESNEGGGEGGGFDKEGTLEFGLKIVKTYFTNNMAEFKSNLDDQVYIMEGDGPYTKAQVINFLDEDDYVASEDYTKHSYQDYIETYAPYVLDVDETKIQYEGLVDTMIGLGWDFDEDDYVFMGWATKSGDEDDGFLWDDPLVFGVTHEDGKWAFKAFSS